MTTETSSVEQAVEGEDSAGPEGSKAEERDEENDKDDGNSAAVFVVLHLN